MKRRTKIQVAAASVTCVALFVALWKASAPFRMKKQFEEQATAGLRGKTSMFKGRFEKVVVSDFGYNKKSDVYNIKYKTSWFIPNSPFKNSSLALSSICSLKNSQGNFSGSCPLGIPLQDDQEPVFRVSIHE